MTLTVAKSCKATVLRLPFYYLFYQFDLQRIFKTLQQMSTVTVIVDRRRNTVDATGVFGE
jgi:hypothetical protein